MRRDEPRLSWLAERLSRRPALAGKLEQLLEEWHQDRESTAVVCDLPEGDEVELYAEWDDGLSVTASIHRAGVYKLSDSTLIAYGIPDVVALSFISGEKTASDLIGGDLLQGIGIDTVIRRGLVYRSSEVVDDLTGNRSSPDWSADNSLSLVLTEPGP